MTRDPIGASVVRAESFDRDVSISHGRERSASGTRPSRDDFENFYWPMLAAELAFSWHEATPLRADYSDVRELTCRAAGMFPPARIVLHIKHRGSEVIVQVLGIQFDWGFNWFADPE